MGARTAVCTVHASTGCHTSVITSVDGNFSMLASHLNHPKKLKQQPEEQVIMNVAWCQEGGNQEK